MKELGIDANEVAAWFENEKDEPYVLVRVSEETVAAWTSALALPVRRCYASDAFLAERAAALGMPAADVLAAKLPNPGAVMAGDFGEVLTFVFQASREAPKPVVGPKKWSLKADRTKSAPGSDVVQFVFASWPTPSAEDVVLCAEVKTKSTASSFAPIKAAIAGCAKDRTSRLGKTVAWLKERAIVGDLGEVSVGMIDRFASATDHPPAVKRFSAVAVVCATLAEAELAADAPSSAAAEYSVVVVVVPNLQAAYTNVFEAVHQSVTGNGGSPTAAT